MRTRIVVTGIGVCTALGENPQALWRNLIGGKTATREWEDLESEGFRQSVACRVTSVECDAMDRGYVLAKRSIDQAIAESRMHPNERCGLFLGSTMGESAAFERAATEEVDLALYGCGGLAKRLAVWYGLNPRVMSFGTACAAGNYALHAAALSLEHGEVDVAIAGGVDPFSKIAMAGFSRSRAMSPTGVCRPFDTERDGMLLGEGSAFFVLERESDARARQAPCLAVIGAMGLTCDAYHATAPEPSGRWMQKAIRQAMDAEDLVAGDISWVCTHGSGTVPSDKVEAAVLEAVFHNSDTGISAFKGSTGHTLGAATAIEAAICILSLKYNTIPPTVGCTKPLETLRNKIIREPREQESQWILNCGYAFGGLNTALLLGSCN